MVTTGREKKGGGEEKMMIDEEGPLPWLYGRLENGVAPAETILQQRRR